MNVTTMREEIFGPVLTVYVYDDDKMNETIDTMAENTRRSSSNSSFSNFISEFALTGAIYCQDESLVQELTMRLRQTAGNFYINDKVILFMDSNNLHPQNLYLDRTRLPDFETQNQHHHHRQLTIQIFVSYSSY